MHGSNTQHLYNYYHIKMPEKILDFSVNTNPLGMPKVINENWSDLLSLVEDYPDPENNVLLTALAKKNNLDKQSILLGNGAAELIALLAGQLRNKAVLIMQPTFYEYERMCLANKCEVTHFLMDLEGDIDFEAFKKSTKSVEAVFFCNPNNPTGKRHPISTIEKMAVICKENSCLFIVDEAFYDFSAEYDNVYQLIHKYSNMVILRSLTKMYAIAGLRLGYILSNPTYILSLKRYLPHWNVNALAQEVGILSLKEDIYVRKTQKYIENEREFMSQELKKIGLTSVNSDVNYYLIRDADEQIQEKLLVFLLKKGIVLRHTLNFPGLKGYWLRVAVKKRSENELLLEALREWQKKK